MLPQTLKLASINIEGHKHIDTVSHFLKQQQPDVVCLQEVFAHDIPTLAESMGYTPYFVPNAQIKAPNRYGIDPLGQWGIGLLSRLPLVSPRFHYYVGTSTNIPALVDGDPNSVNRAIITAKVKLATGTVFLATTHLTWTPNGSFTPQQYRDLQILLQKLQRSLTKPFVLCGDFNAPRGGESWAILAKHYTDNIPENVTTTIDGTVHYAGNLQLVVDGFFSTPMAKVQNVQIHTGVSDHCALTATVGLA